jgi:hypothetical protein
MKTRYITENNPYRLSAVYFRKLITEVKTDIITKVQITLNIYATGVNPVNLQFARNTIYVWLIPYVLKGDLKTIERCLDEIAKFQDSVGHIVVPKDHSIWGLPDMIKRNSKFKNQ